MQRKIKFITVLALLFSLAFCLTTSQKVFAGLNFNVSATDTIAGYSALIKTSQIEAKTDVDFLITKPNGAEIKLQETSNVGGITEAEFFGYNTKKAGLYTIAAKRKSETTYSNTNTFRVYADTLSSSQSMLKSDKTGAASDASETVYLTVTLTDKYRNPISNHQVKLISSRPEDEIETSSSAISDVNGNVVFAVTSRYAGISIYSAFDVNTGITLDDRVKVVYFEPYESNLAIGGSYLQADLLASDDSTDSTESSSWPIKYFDIEIPDEVTVNTAETIKVIARDSNKNIAKDYTGTILFATPDDDNATLPSDDGEFTFSAKDQGEFSFNLAITFTQVGLQTIQVYDSEDWDILGEKKINVIEENNGSDTPDAVGTLEIKTPTDGSVISTTTLSLSGQGSAKDQLKIFDNDVKIGETEIDSSGFFTFTAQNLSDGLHAFYAKGDSDVSSTINITIDSTPPIIDSFAISPEWTLEIGATFTITLESEANLRKSQIRLNGIMEQLVESSQTSGKYEGTFVAPNIAGNYQIDVILTDELSNQGEYRNKTVLEVEDTTVALPAKVTSLRAKTDDQKIYLSWEAVTDHVNPIAKYRIYYGETETNLTKTAETNGAVETWYIPNLTNGTKYYFAITAIDNQNNESSEKGLIVNAIPTKKESLVRAVASDTKVTLSWSSSGQNPSQYKIKYGVQSGQYSESVITSDNGTTWYIPDLINGVTYYFQVVALDSAGNELKSAEEVSATPFGDGFKAVSGGQNYVLPQQIAKVTNTSGTWPEIWIVVLFSMLFIDIILRLRKKFI